MKSNHSKCPFTLAFLAALVLSLEVGHGQTAAFTNQPAAKPSAPAVLPGDGLAQHDFFYTGETRTRDTYIVRRGKVVWAYHDAGGKGEISDAILLSCTSHPDFEIGEPVELGFQEGIAYPSNHNKRTPKRTPQQLIRV